MLENKVTNAHEPPSGNYARAIEKFKEYRREAAKAITTSNNSNHNHGYSSDVGGTSPNTIFPNTTTTGTGTWQQLSFPISDAQDANIQELSDKIEGLSDMLAAAWDAITDLQNALDEGES